ncbi:hypothetical protein ACFL6M_07640 [Candidatus Eisenbacteria bacterium]|uniref:Uncharacterized protein n=1 Tax=Eiseniibacteriota bacterium TaxID=2212470 RepID=A0ABV6YM90_UNCEI
MRALLAIPILISVAGCGSPSVDVYAQAYRSAARRPSDHFGSHNTYRAETAKCEHCSSYGSVRLPASPYIVIATITGTTPLPFSIKDDRLLVPPGPFRKEWEEVLTAIAERASECGGDAMVIVSEADTFAWQHFRKRVPQANLHDPQIDLGDRVVPARELVVVADVVAFADSAGR